MANPSQLPDHIIDLFLERLPCVEDFVRSGAVCKSWQSVVSAATRQITPSFSPWLMLSTHDDNNDEQQQQQPIQTFFSLSSKKPFNLQLPQTRGRRCWGSPFGWLVTFGLDLNIHLLNPFSQVQLPLPSQPTFQNQYTRFRGAQQERQFFVAKFVLSSNPSSPHPQHPCLVMAIYSEFRELAFAKPGDEAWTSVEHPPHPCYQDVIFFKGLIYALTTNGFIFVCDPNTPHPKATEFASPPDDVDGPNTFYLVEMSGDLYFVERIFYMVDEDEDEDKDKDPKPFIIQNRTYGFEVHKFDFQTRTWTELDDLGDHALFLGNGTSFSISTSDYPEFKRSCVYFADDHSELYCCRFCDMGVYDMVEKTVKPIYSGNEYVHSTFSRPLILVPSL